MTVVYWELLPDVQVCQGPTRAHCTQHTVRPGLREPIVAEAADRRKEAAISRLLKPPVPNSSKPLLLAQGLLAITFGMFWILNQGGLKGFWLMWMNEPRDA